MKYDTPYLSVGALQADSQEKARDNVSEEDERGLINENVKPLDLEKVYDCVPCPEEADTKLCHVLEYIVHVLPIKVSALIMTLKLTKLLGDYRKLCLKETKLIDPDADLPPLLKAITCSKDSRLLLLQQTLQYLKEEEDMKLMKTVIVNKPEHPQSAFVNVTLPQKTIARTADDRVSDRVLTEMIDMQIYPPVYNDLTGEIDDSYVKWLDRNLFFGEEIREVDKKISTHHLKYDQDPAIEPVATEVDLLKMTSSTLTKGRRKWVINPELRQALESQTSKWECRKKYYIDGDHPKPQAYTVNPGCSGGCPQFILTIT
ncbi:coiled-coil domain-containing protein 87-like [Acipenser ruthenus]|uniref:coiled-coil domain-containing protein 87-like n=1 Tax=Acipenser ruthenus TaxID=7906 RepID=UPI002741B0B5|nr:coiled-coil domain-containing protein 87-like [Acipenser ruthenus]